MLDSISSIRQFIQLASFPIGYSQLQYTSTLSYKLKSGPLQWASRSRASGQLSVSWRCVHLMSMIFKMSVDRSFTEFSNSTLAQQLHLIRLRLTHYKQAPIWLQLDTLAIVDASVVPTGSVFGFFLQQCDKNIVRLRLFSRLCVFPSGLASLD